MNEIKKLIKDQLSVWPLAATNFRALKSLKTKELEVNGMRCKVQFNPERMASTTAETDPETIASRPCFLCEDNRPAEQFHIRFEGRKGARYNVQVNPFPIFPDHLVIARKEHVPQTIWHHFQDMLDFAHRNPEYTVFYNGPYSGASAPDHLHFQACPRLLMPLEKEADSFLDNPGKPLASVKEAGLYAYPHFANGIFVLKASTAKSISKLFYRLLECADIQNGEPEPRFNLFVYFQGGEYRAITVLRSQVRSHHYYSEGEDHLSISPGAADMTGIFIAPVERDFDKVDSAALGEMIEEVTITDREQEMVLRRLTRTEERIDVGILSAREITFEIISDGAGPQTISWSDGRILYNGALFDELYFDSITRSTLFAEPSFILHDVVIGIDFHWQQKRTLKFAGGLKFIVEGDRITAVNRIGMENYLLSVISSEMKSSASVELLKAHAVISRSWCLRRIEERKRFLEGDGSVEPAHINFDVCADDHCQRYQGLTMAVGEKVRKAIDETWGQVLRYKGLVCDARYSKCCGGRTELYSTCWEDEDPGYLKSLDDSDGGRCFCDCEDDAILSQVLNDYDLQTKDFYRWEVRYGKEELSRLVRERTGEDYGEILNLEPLETGPSGRIKYLRIKGSLKTGTIGKELKIRRALSPNHLKSSAFEVSREGDEFILKGKGWGHGVGLCQIGAAVMAEKGYSYKEILKHYYDGTEIG